MHCCALVLLTLVAISLGQQFQCELEMSTRVMRNGVVRGTFKMDIGPSGAYSIYLPPTQAREAFTEIVQFNSKNGLDGTTVVPYNDQIIFRSGTSCACETGYFDDTIPILNPTDDKLASILTAMFTKTPASAANTCDTYTLRQTPDPTNPATAAFGLAKLSSALTEVQINPATKYPCSAKWVDGRTMKFTNCAAPAEKFTRQTTFAPPSGCKCGKPIDVVIVLDRSSSISYREFLDQRGFVIDFANQFDFDPVKANLAIINFQRRSWVHLSITDGVSNANVNASVQSLGCPASCDNSGKGECQPATNADTCCCCCGTCIACGQILGALQFAKGRSFAFKLLIVITDGAANHAAGPTDGFNQQTTEIVGTNCPGSCTADLTRAAAFSKAQATDPSKVALYAVGVGADRAAFESELKLVAGGDSSKVLYRDSFSQLASVNVELISRSCDQNTAPCGGCCGFCLCGVCQAPDACVDTSPCEKGTRANGQICCSTTPVSCASETAADKCNTYVCSNTTGNCVATNPIVCPPASNTTCFNRSCVPATGVCRTSPTGVCPPVQECVSSSDCNDNNDCTIEVCSPDGACNWTEVVCAATPAFTPDQCSVVGCERTGGCFKRPLPNNTCDDNNECTIDTCDPATGCVHTPVVCEDDGNLCTRTVCDPVRKCIHIPILCNGTGNTTCKIFYCNQTDGNCTFKATDCEPVFPLVTAVGAGLGALAIVGIIIAAVLCFAGAAGGGAYAYTQAANGGMNANVMSNPTYKEAGNSGTNPMYNPGRN